MSWATCASSIPAVGSGVLLWASLEVMLALDSACDGIIGRAAGLPARQHEMGASAAATSSATASTASTSPRRPSSSRVSASGSAVALSESEAQPLPDLELNVTQGRQPASVAIGGAATGRGAGKAKQLSLGLSDRDELENRLERLTRKYMMPGRATPWSSGKSEPRSWTRTPRARGIGRRARCRGAPARLEDVLPPRVPG